MIVYRTLFAEELVYYLNYAQKMRHDKWKYFFKCRDIHQQSNVLGHLSEIILII